MRCFPLVWVNTTSTPPPGGQGQGARLWAGALARRTLARVARRLGPDSQGAVLLGVKGVVVVGHASSSPTAVSACIGVAAEAVRDGLVPRLTETMAGLIERRRAGQSPSDAQQRQPA